MTANAIPNLLDQVILVNEADHPIGAMDKIAAHRGDAVLHRAVSVYLFDEAGRLLIQQRSQQKIVGAGLWANTCCGNVRPGESYLECAERRLREELGITGVALSAVYKFMYHVRCNDEFSEREMDQVFVGKVLFDELSMSANPSEVSATQWVALADLAAALKPEEVAPWFAIMNRDKQLQVLLRGFYEQS